jgi:hypothetical protein
MEQRTDNRSKETATTQSGLDNPSATRTGGQSTRPGFVQRRHIDSKLRGYDLVKLAVSDLVKDDRVRKRVSVIQSKTKRSVQFELKENTRKLS